MSRLEVIALHWEVNGMIILKIFLIFNSIKFAGSCNGHVHYVSGINLGANFKFQNNFTFAIQWGSQSASRVLHTRVLFSNVYSRSLRSFSICFVLR